MKTRRHNPEIQDSLCRHVWSDLCFRDLILIQSLTDTDEFGIDDQGGWNEIVNMDFDLQMCTCIFCRCKQLDKLDLSGCDQLLRPSFFQLVGHISDQITWINLGECSSANDSLIKV